jgi:hypothetical protein
MEIGATTSPDDRDGRTRRARQIVSWPRRKDHRRSLRPRARPQTRQDDISGICPRGNGHLAGRATERVVSA